MATNFTEMFTVVKEGIALADLTLSEASLLDIAIALVAFSEKQTVSNDAYGKVVLNGLKHIFDCARKTFELDHALSKDESKEFASLLFLALNKKPNMRDDEYFVPLEEGVKSMPFTRGFHLTYTEQELTLSKASVVTLTRAFRLMYQRVLNRFCGASDPTRWTVKNAVGVLENRLKKEVHADFPAFATALIKNYREHLYSLDLDLSDVMLVHASAVEAGRHSRTVSRAKESHSVKHTTPRYEEPVKKDPTKSVASVVVSRPDLLKAPVQNPWEKLKETNKLKEAESVTPVVVDDELRERFETKLKEVVTHKGVGKPYVQHVAKTTKPKTEKVKEKTEVETVEEGWTKVGKEAVKPKPKVARR